MYIAKILNMNEISFWCSIFSIKTISININFIISFTSDWLYPTSENKEIVIALNAAGANVGFIEIKSDKGHDSFLLNVPDFLKSVKNFLEANY